MNIPAFSIFSAVSEVFVTILVLYVIITNLRGRPFRWKLLGVGLLFELCINVVYMVRRAAVVEDEAALTPVVKALFAVHGILSLVMFVALLLVYIISAFEQKIGECTWFQRHPSLTWTFIGLWLFAVGSGEFAFVWRYLLPSA